MPGPKVRPPKVEYNSISGQQYYTSDPYYHTWELESFTWGPEYRTSGPEYSTSEQQSMTSGPPVKQEIFIFRHGGGPVSKPASQSVTILKLPRELIHAICEILLELPWGDVDPHEPAYASHAKSALHKGRTHLRNFGLISRIIHPVVQRLLYRDITFFNHKRSTHLRLLRTVDSSPTLGSLISCVDFAWFPSIAYKPKSSQQIQLPLKPKQTKPNKDPTHLQTWFYKNLSQSIFCDRDKSDDSSSPDIRCSIYEGHGLCMMLLSQLPNLRSARIRLPNLAYPWRRSFQDRNLRWPSRNPRLTNLTELQLVPQSASSFPLYTSIGVLNGTRNLTTLVLINARDPIVSPSTLKLPHLRVLVIKDGGLFLKPHLIKHLTKSFKNLGHFQIDFFDHHQTFNLGTNYAEEIWTPGRYFAEFEVDWDDASLPTNTNPRSSTITVPSLNRYCNAATNLLHSLELVSGTLESLYIGQLSIHLRSCRDKRGRCRIKSNPGIERLCSLQTFPKLKRVCIDVRMIDKIDDPTQPEVLVDLLKDCQELEAVLFYGLYHVNMEDQFEVFAKSVSNGELCPRLRKVALLADDFGKDGRQVRFIEVLGGLAMVWKKWNKGDGNKGVELVLLRDGDADVEVESDG
ncbi:hypothetical protein V8F33_006064 [Rhypophila sp. PSN 637]